jgi:hypothetical protein
MADDTTRASSGGGVRGLLTWVLILGLLGLVAWLASDRNARTWYLVPDDGRLVVMKGMFLPAGRQPFKTADPALAQAYAPLVLPPGKPLPDEQGYPERSQLDQALYDLVAGWAREDIGSGEAARLERGLAYLGRAEQLSGISGAQRNDLSALRAESGYFEAQRLLSTAAEALQGAAQKLRLAAGSRSSHAMDAQLLLRDVDPAVNATVDALRAAGRHGPVPRPGAGAAEDAKTPPVEAGSPSDSAR